MVAASSLRRRGYDVFLSFRGDDTRNGFTGHLYEAMKRKGIRVFIDNRGLEKGRDINPQLTRAIEDSRFAVVVFSKQYADSTWCLDEVAKIHDGMREEGFTALPVFYHVRSSDVREHKGCFEGAFQKHGNRGEDPLRVSRWKTALTTLATQTGWTVDDRTNEADIVEAIARVISSKRWVMFPGIASELVGFESQIDPVVKMMDFKSDSSRIIGITGMGGIGKSAIARAVYERMLGLFDVGSFLANIGRNSVKNGGLVSLQKQLLTETSREENVNVFNEKDGIKRIRSQLGNRKVILVLDDIDGPEQFEALAGDLDWFGPGSRILITTRDKHLLRNAHFTKEIQLLSNDDARDLFRWNAFGREETVSTDFEPMFDKVVDYCGGLPLALKELGCLLAGKTMTEWENSIDKLKENPNRRIMDRLEISYASLDETQKSTFLYIACFLADAMEEDMKFIMDCLGLFPHINIKTLMERCLVSVSEGRVQMHNLLRELGRDLARRESPAGPTKQLIMCSFPDIQKALDMEMGSGSVEALVLDQSAQQSQHGELLSLNGLSRFDKLKLLHINEVYNFSGKLNSLSNEMKHLVWHSCPLKWLPSNFQPHGLCYLDLCSSNITNLWDYNQRLDKLTRVILCNSKKLIKCPDLSNLPNLQSLNLEGCISLIELCSSRPLHERLSNLNLRGCTRLRHLPKQINFPSLETFVLSGCVSLTRLPEISGPMARLTELHLDGSSILEVPPSYYFLTGLVQLNASNCAHLLTPPRTILDMMKNLICIIQDGCISSIKMPVDLEKQNLDPPRAEAEAQQVLGSGPVTFFKYIVARTKTYTKYELQVGVQEKPLESYQILLRVLRSPACVRVLEKPLKSYQHLLRVFRSPTHEVPKEGLLKSYWQLLRVSRGPQRVGVQEKPLKSYQNVLRIFRRSPRVGVEETPLESSQRLLRVFRSPWCARMQEKPSKSYQKLLRVFISPLCVQGQVRQLDSYQILLKVLRSPRCVPDKPLKSSKLLLRVFRFPMSVGEKKKLLKSYHLLLGVFRGPPSAKVQEKQLNSYQQLIGVFRRPLRVGVKDKFLKFYQQLLRVFGCPPRMGVKEKQLKSSQPLLSMFRSLPWVEVREKLMKSYKRLLKVLRISSRGGVKEKPLKFYQKLLRVFRSLVRADVHGKSLNPYHILLRALRSALSMRVDKPWNSYQIILRVFRRSWRVGVQEKSMKCYQRLLRVFKRPPRERMPEKPLNSYQKLLRVFQIHLPVGVEETRVKSSWRLLRVFRKQARPEVQEKPRKSYQKLLRVFKSPPPVRVQEAPLKSHLHLRVFRKQAREGVQEKPLKLNQKLLRVFQSPPPVGGQETPVKSFRQLLRVPRKPACVGVQEKPLKFYHRLFRAFKIPRVWECMGNRRNPTSYC